jgi:hypothetical protein
VLIKTETVELMAAFTFTEPKTHWEISQGDDGEANGENAK